MKKLFYCVLAMMLVCVPAFGQTFKVIHSFSGYPNDGSAAISNVVFDQAGNLYGTTPGGGSGFVCGDNGCGTAYELSPNKDGSWTETVIYNFCSVISGNACQDGAYPDAGLIIDASGNLYGTASAGGGVPCPPLGTLGCGIIFELSPPIIPGAAWSEATLYNFCSRFQNGACLDGQGPTGQLVFDSVGNLYGTATGGGAGHIKQSSGAGGGVAFELSLRAGTWTESVLYNFCSKGGGDSCPDGYIPNAGLIFDRSGNLYGTTDYSGNAFAFVGGTVYELSHGGGGWTHQTLAAIPSNSRSDWLLAPIAIDSGGNLYTTFSGANGGLYRLDPATRKLGIFSFNGVDGLDPLGGSYVDSQSATLYGTTSGGGSKPGNVFKIVKSGKETVLHNFCSFSNCTDGESPWSNLTPDRNRNLYGTTEFGGDFGSGVVFEITP